LTGRLFDYLFFYQANNQILKYSNNQCSSAAEAMEKYEIDRPDIRKDKNDPNELAFVFVVDFPVFEWKESEKRWDAVHHPFTRPQTDDIEALKKNPGTIPSYQYDFVLNGYEIGGGSLRITNPALQEAVFEIMGFKKERIKENPNNLDVYVDAMSACNRLGRDSEADQLENEYYNRKIRLDKGN